MDIAANPIVNWVNCLHSHNLSLIRIEPVSTHILRWVTIPGFQTELARLHVSGLQPV